jgi:hypothetical protein
MYEKRLDIFFKHSRSLADTEKHGHRLRAEGRADKVIQERGIFERLNLA